MKNLLIVGAGGWGRVVRQWALDIQNHARRWGTIKFLDDNQAALDSFGLREALNGDVETHSPLEDTEYACGIGDPAMKLKICQQLQQKGAIFTNIIHPSAIVTEHCQFGCGIVVSPFAAVVVNTSVDDFVTINAFSVVGHDAVIGKGCTLSAHCDVMANVQLAEQVFLGSGSRILPHIKVGCGAKVGAGAVVIRNVPTGATVFGNPAKLIC